ncbi:MAG TPA: PHP domain-containing protein [Actinomycetota bacterium]|nr:PHP domain-containing protein [Actinomycetota bacterium]
MPLSNARLADLLYGAADSYEGQKQRALRRAGRYALVWPEEAWRILEEGRSLTELPAVGPWVARMVGEWVENPPEPADGPNRLRSGFITYSEATSILEDDPSWKEELRGDLQMHSTYSDGTVSISEMAGAAATLGYGYIGITDHSKGLRIAGGIDEEVLASQGAEIDDVNRQLDELDADLRVLRSIELNFGRGGEGDMDPAALGVLDVVVGSFHSRLRVKEDQTERCLGAMRNPDVQIVGHPMGRMFGVRAGVQADWERVLDEGRQRGKAFEINAQPNRQDFSVEMLERARDAGVVLSIGTDAHSVGELYNVDLSLAAACIAGIPKEQILNFMEVDEVLAWVAESRARAGRT